MKATHKDHISIFDDVIEKEVCDQIIELFDLYDSVHGSMNSKDYDGTGNLLYRNDTSLFCGEDLFPEIRNYMHELLSYYYEEYQKHFFQAAGISIGFDEVKIQRTPVRGGFHTWHCEIGDISSIDRSIVWMLYLNDIPENEGETEFLWQKMRIQPKAGRLVMWPAFFTHTHRGNPVYTHSKYIITGWGIYKDEKMDAIYFRDRRGFYHRNS